MRARTGSGRRSAAAGRWPGAAGLAGWIGRVRERVRALAGLLALYLRALGTLLRLLLHPADPNNLFAAGAADATGGPSAGARTKARS